MALATTASGLAEMLDHTLLGAAVTDRDLAEHCREAADYGFAAVAVTGANVAFCAGRLQGTDVAVCAAVGFPLGQQATAAKVFEAEQALRDGATEIDFVINVGALKSGRYDALRQEITDVVAVCDGRVSKVILETCYLTDVEKQAVCEMAIEAGATFVKTSTGLATGGATLPDVYLLRSVAQDRIQVKASGGIRTLDQALSYIDAGCTRIGTSRAVAIVVEAREVLPA